VASLLTFASQAPAKLAGVDVNSVLQTAVRLLTPQLEAKSTSMRVELAPMLPPVLADSNQILHVCMHLADRSARPPIAERTRPCSFTPTLRVTA
jgi:C4-dicarboxylate-specific signal transduction histidine kinase